MGNIFYYKTDIGKIGIAENDGYITNLIYETELCTKGFITNESEILKEANKQLQEYFSGKRKMFSLPLAPNGTEFMKKVWNRLIEIPYGKTQSYKEVAGGIGNPKACRAVGLANNKNPIPIIIPCHRVIGADGRLIGYGGGLEIKAYLLNLESKKKI